MTVLWRRPRQVPPQTAVSVVPGDTTVAGPLGGTGTSVLAPSSPTPGLAATTPATSIPSPSAPTEVSTALTTATETLAVTPTDVATVTMTVSPTTTAAAASGGLSDGAAVGIGLAIVFALAAVCAGGFFYFQRRRRRVRGRVDPYATNSAGGTRAMPMEPLRARRSILKRPGAGPGIYSSVNDYSRLLDDDEALPEYQPRALPLSPTRDLELGGAKDTENVAGPSTPRPLMATVGVPALALPARPRSTSIDSSASTATIRPFTLNVQPPTAPPSGNVSAAVTPRASRSASPSPAASRQGPLADKSEVLTEPETQRPMSALYRSDTFGATSSSAASTADSSSSEDVPATYQEVRRGRPAQATTVTDVISVSRAGTIIETGTTSASGSSGSVAASEGDGDGLHGL